MDRLYVLERPGVDAGSLLVDLRRNGVTWNELIQALIDDGYDPRPLIEYLGGDGMSGWWTDLKNTVGSSTRGAIRDFVPGGNVLVALGDGAKQVLSGILTGAKAGGQDAAEGWLSQIVAKLPIGTKARVAIGSIPPIVLYIGIGLVVWMLFKRARR